MHVGDRDLVGRLLEYFEGQPDCVAVQVGEAEIEVSLLGSYRNDAHHEMVERLLLQFRSVRNGDSPA